MKSLTIFISFILLSISLFSQSWRQNFKDDVRFLKNCEIVLESSKSDKINKIQMASAAETWPHNKIVFLDADQIEKLRREDKKVVLNILTAITQRYTSEYITEKEEKKHSLWIPGSGKQIGQNVTILASVATSCGVGYNTNNTSDQGCDIKDIKGKIHLFNSIIKQQIDFKLTVINMRWVSSKLRLNEAHFEKRLSLLKSKTLILNKNDVQEGIEKKMESKYKYNFCLLEPKEYEKRILERRETDIILLLAKSNYPIIYLLESQNLDLHYIDADSPAIGGTDKKTTLKYKKIKALFKNIRVKKNKLID